MISQIYFIFLTSFSYSPLDVVIKKGKGVTVWDMEDKKYFDFLSSYSAVNQGHCHPKIIKTFQEQSEILTLSSRAYYSNMFPIWAKYVTEYFGFEKVLPMNTGAEAVESAIKIARKWGYDVKKIPEDDALILCCSGMLNFIFKSIR